MELQEIITFVSVVQHESFSKGAKSLGYSQAAVTIHIKKLESELGVHLFDRLGKRIRLTHAGKIFYDHALKILNEVAVSKADLKTSSELRGSLTIGTITSLCESLFPSLIMRFHTVHPYVSLNIQTDSPANLMELLYNNEIDILYLMDRKLHEPSLIKYMEEKERIIFLASNNNPLADHRPHTLDELFRQPIILTEKDASYRKVLEEQLYEKNREIIPVIESDNTDILLKLTRNNMGITFLPEFFLKEESGADLCEILVPECNVYVYRQVVYHRDKWVTNEMKAFLDLLTTVQES
ncbi:MAG: LysR family transcriptional regulator [Solobacterium sp.]|nr:LysR family transcriptional regulator [Solobacterium sp.]